MPRLENWALVRPLPDDPFQAPEMVPPHLVGAVYGHPRYPDGKKVRTGPLRAAEGRTVITRNTHYELGTPAPEYLASLNNPLDDENPLGVFGQSVTSASGN